MRCKGDREEKTQRLNDIFSDNISLSGEFETKKVEGKDLYLSYSLTSTPGACILTSIHRNIQNQNIHTCFKGLCAFMLPFVF